MTRIFWQRLTSTLSCKIAHNFFLSVFHASKILRRPQPLCLKPIQFQWCEKAAWLLLNSPSRAVCVADLAPKTYLDHILDPGVGCESTRAGTQKEQPKTARKAREIQEQACASHLDPHPNRILMESCICLNYNESGEIKKIEG
jgi:hypothetical protein